MNVPEPALLLFLLGVALVILAIMGFALRRRH
jgi:hypothetical protein